MPEVTFEQEARDLLARAGVANAQAFPDESVAELASVITRICQLEIAMTARQAAAKQAGTTAKTIEVAESLNKMVDKLFTNELGPTDVMYLATMDSVSKKVQLARHNLSADGAVWMLTQLLNAAKQEVAAANVGKLIIPGHHNIPGRH